MTSKGKTILVVFIGWYPVVSILDAMLYSIAGLSFFVSTTEVYPHDGGKIIRLMLTITLSFVTALCAFLIDTED